MGFIKEASYSTPHKAKISLDQAPSAAELLRALRDVVLVLQSLFLECKTLHRHIDFNNILIENKDGIRGVVVDLDYPDPLDGSWMDHVTKEQRDSRCVALRKLAFQTLDQLRANDHNPTRPGRVSDDVKSLFYVLCWVYEAEPIIDYFCYVNEDVVAGIMESKDPDLLGGFYFYLKRYNPEM
ncbi:hypothetical protein FB45DRAFT_1052730 [Roridomyces roridus]|uniref:Fungal-type protein kinase domain-containing protein n=1 Tax=Roridomyces roridus TaxID=1738132 RepID=A0AAD7CAE8_9AGAR|nr:hypothetical protein FB45DRAFT_1052730 [Roridomyces roridus]